MPRILLVLLALFAILFCQNSSHAFVIEPTLADKKLEQRAQELFKEIRCVVCISQSVAESDNELAGDIRTLVRKMIQQGSSDDNIKAYLSSRYGKEILLSPPLEKDTYILWFTPFVLLALGIAILTVRSKRSVRAKR